MKKIHVLQVVDYLNHNSGVASVVLNYFMQIDSEEVQFDFLLFDRPEKELEELLINKGSRIYVVEKPTVKTALLFQNKIKSFFETNGKEYNIVHVHIPVAAYCVLHYAKKNDVEHRIIHSHNSQGADGIVKSIRNGILCKIGCTYANHFFACSELAANFLYGERGKNRKNAVIIYNAIDKEKFRPDAVARKEIREKLRVDEEVLLGSVGRFSKQKNQKMLIDILKELQNRGVKSKLLLIGDGELKEEILMYAKKNNVVNDVILCGVVIDVQRYLNAMDVFLMPSFYEGLPLSCVEAQMTGLACVVSKTITKEVKISNRLYYQNIERINDWTDCICGIIDNNTGEKEKVIADKFDIKIQSHKLCNIYKSFV